MRSKQCFAKKNGQAVLEWLLIGIPILLIWISVTLILFSELQTSFREAYCVLATRRALSGLKTKALPGMHITTKTFDGKTSGIVSYGSKIQIFTIKTPIQSTVPSYFGSAWQLLSPL